MALTPYHYLPKRLFLRRMIRLAVLVYFAGFLLMGLLSADHRVNLPPLTMAQYQHGKFVRLLTNPPGICASSSESEFKTERCTEYAKELAGVGLWVLFPFFCAGIFLRLSFAQLKEVYEAGARKLESGQKLFTGMVTDPPEMPNDFYGWALCFRSVTVELGENKQFRVYVPFEGELPKPGTRMAIADVGKRYKRTRYLAAPYTPHVAVVKG